MQVTRPSTIRTATPRDVAAIVALLVQDAEQRRKVDPSLWRVSADAPGRIAKAIDAVSGGTGEPMRELWLVAEHASRIVGLTHAMMLPVPPIYDGAAGDPGLFLDDCCLSADAPPDSADALLLATERALEGAGAPTLIASCTAGGPLRPLYERHGYEPVTLFMAKHRFSHDGLPKPVRPAMVDDVPGIVKLSARHRRTLTEVGPRFWHIHPDADRRFDAWMHRSLTLKDRDMFVEGAAGDVHGYVIAQPCSPLLMPITAEVAGVGVIDDFYDEDFAAISAVENGGSGGAALLTAAESAFAQRSIDSTLAVCPAAWLSKTSLLEQSGYRTAKIWMLKKV